jgi:hypothetical protein
MSSPPDQHHERPHGQARRAMTAAWAAGRLPHALLVTGEQGIGKLAFARWLLAMRWCEAEQAPCGACASCRKLETGNHPDACVVKRDPTPEQDPEGWGSKHEITVDQVRKGVLPLLALRAVEGGGRAVLIHDAADLNEEAQNSLLKTLEEPPSGSLLVLVTEREEGLLDTVRSRCQELRLFPLPIDPDGETSSAERLLRGRPGRAEALAELSVETLIEAFDLLLQGKTAPTLFAKQAEELTTGDEPGDLRRLHLGLEVLHLRLRDVILVREGGDPSVAVTPVPVDPVGFPATDRLIACETPVLEAVQDLRRHVPVAVLWVALGSEIARARVGARALSEPNP